MRSQSIHGISVRSLSAFKRELPVEMRTPDHVTPASYRRFQLGGILSGGVAVAFWFYADRRPVIKESDELVRILATLVKKHPDGR
jgi:hypothetical protein